MLAALIVLAVPSSWGQIGAIVMGALAGIALLRAPAPTDHAALPLKVRRATGLTMLGLYFALLIGLPLLASVTSSQTVKLLDAFYRTGSLVFGGGHVVLPLLQLPLFLPAGSQMTRSLRAMAPRKRYRDRCSRLLLISGAVMGPQPNGWIGAGICLVAVFAPSFLLVIGALPFWEELRHRPAAQAALRGVNAAVVGLLLAALYIPVWTTGISNARDFGLACAAFLLLFMRKAPPWLAVILSAVAGAAIATI
jgi:chromate transporter